MRDYDAVEGERWEEESWERGWEREGMWGLGAGRIIGWKGNGWERNRL